MPDLSGKVVIITGASSGIGEATALALGRAGARVVLAARRLDRLETLAAEIEARGGGGETLTVAADVSQLADIQEVVKRARDRFGRIDVLFNNAGLGCFDWLEKLDPVGGIETQVAVDLLGVIQMTRQALPVMMAQRSGHILNMVSMAGLVGTPTYTIYAASKFGVHGFSEALRREVAPWGIRVSAIYPGGVTTEFGSRAGIKRKTGTTTPSLLQLSPDDVARAVLGLLRRPRPSLIIPWPFRLVAYTNQLFPGLVDWAVINRYTIPERREEMAGK